MIIANILNQPLCVHMGPGEPVLHVAGNSTVTVTSNVISDDLWRMLRRGMIRVKSDCEVPGGEPYQYKNTVQAFAHDDDFDEPDTDLHVSIDTDVDPATVLLPLFIPESDRDPIPVDNHETQEPDPFHDLDEADA